MATEDDTPRHPTGMIQQYTDPMGRTQTSVIGPEGHILITRVGLAPYEVWHSHEAFRKLVTTRDKGRALGVALKAAGIEV